MSKKIYSIKPYGKVTINIKKYMDTKNLTRNSLARATHTSIDVINRWYNGHVEKISADILARICYVLECTPGDIIHFSDLDTTK